MKKGVIFLFTIELTTLLVAACRQGAGDVELRTFEAVDTVWIQSKNDVSDSAMFCVATCKLVLPVADTLSAHRLGVDRINRFIIDELLTGCRGTTETEAAQQFVFANCQMMAEDMRTMYGSKGYDYGAVFSHQLTTEAHWGFDDKVLCYTMESNVYEGGAHPVTRTRMMSFSFENGNVIRPSDVFRDGYEAPLCERLTQKLMEQQGAESLDELHAQGVLDLSDMYVSDDMLLEADDIVFHYDPYELAPYALGSIDISLTYQDVEDLLRSTQP